MIFRWDFIGKGRFCLYLWAQVYCLSGAGLLCAQICRPWVLPCKHRHCPQPGFTGAAACVFTGSSPAYSQGAPTVYSPRSSPAHSQGVTCAFTGRAACAATLGRPRAPQLPRAQAPGSRPCAATARRPWAPECRQAPVLCLACPAARGPQWGGLTPLGWQWVGLALQWVVQGPTTPLGLRWAVARWWAGQELSACQWGPPWELARAGQWVQPLDWPWEPQWAHQLG